MGFRDFRVLIVGCGLMGGGSNEYYPSHAFGVSQVSGLKLVGGVDESVAARAAFQDLYSCPTYASVSSAISDLLPDIVVVATPSDTHVMLSRQVLESDHETSLLVIEKPLCKAKSDLDRLVKLGLGASTSVYVNHSRRFSFGLGSLKEFLATAPLGHLISAEFRYYGGWMNNGVHALDLLSMLSGELPQVVSAVYLQSESSDQGLVFSGQQPISGATVSVRPMQLPYQIFEGELFFESGRINLRDFAYQIEIQRITKNGWGETLLLPSTIWSNPEPEPVVELMRDLRNKLNGENSDRLEKTSLQNVIPLMRLMFEVEELAKSSAAHA